MLLSEQQGTIALPTSEIGRFTLFTVTLSATRQPSETQLAVNASASIAENLNASIKMLRHEDAWLWIIGDDHVWEPTCLMRLLQVMDEREDIDVLVPMVVKRSPPWQLVIFHDAGFDDEGYPAFRPYSWNEVPEPGQPFEVFAAGSAGMVVRRKVIDALSYPWFESSDGIVLNEDVYFCKKIREAGFSIFASPDVTMGHLGIFNVRPMYHEGRWGALTEFTTPEEQFKHMFMPTMDEMETTISAR